MDGTIARFPPYWLIVEQVAALTSADPLSVLVHVTAAPVESDPASCRTTDPDPAVFVELVIAAAKADSVPDIDSASTAADATPAISRTG